MDKHKTRIREIPRNFSNSAKNAAFRDFRRIAENQPSPRHQTLSCTITIMCMTEVSGYQPFCLWSRLTHRLQRDYARQAYTDSYYAALLPRRGPHIASHSVCPSVRLSVRPSRYHYRASPSRGAT